MRWVKRILIGLLGLVLIVILAVAGVVVAVSYTHLTLPTKRIV